MTKEKRGNNVKRSVKHTLDFWRHLNPNLKIVLVLFILLNLLALGAVFYLNRQSLIRSINQILPTPSLEKVQSPSPQTLERKKSQLPPAPSPTPKPKPPKDYDLKISDQIEGIILTVDYLASPKNGWLVLYKDVNGKPELLEEAIPPFEGVTYSNIVFILRTPLLLGQKYFALLHTEDGDGSFEFPGIDKEALNSKGEKVMQSFTVK